MTTITQASKAIKEAILRIETNSYVRYITGNGNGTVQAPDSGRIYVRNDGDRSYTEAINFAVNPEYSDIPVYCKRMPDGSLHVTNPDFNQLLNNGYSWETVLSQIWLPTSMAIKNQDNNLRAMLIGASWFVMGGRLNFGTGYIGDTGEYIPVVTTAPASGMDALFYVGITNNDPPILTTGKSSDATTGTLTVADIDPMVVFSADVMPLACTIISNGEVTFTGNQVYDLRGRYEPLGTPNPINVGYMVGAGRQVTLHGALNISGDLDVRGELNIEA